MTSIAAPSRKRRATPEADIQRDIVSLVRGVMPGAILHHSANEIRAGGEAARKRQGIQVGMGVHPGFADLILIAQGRVMFIEVKSRTGALSGPQERFRDDVQAQGFAWALVRSADDALAAIEAAGFTTRRKSYRIEAAE